MRAFLSAVLGVLIVASLGGAACNTAGSLIGPGETGLRGQVLRGPIQPVCQEGEPCEDAPFAATFYVYRGSRRIATFRSDAEGRFEIALAPGAYGIVPDEDAPVMAPASQRQEVVVAREGVTEVTLHFDTGIR
ncbi:MAG TPA: hypothetical protein VD962_07970 [Rubricoccaceae bacterium]|nr:hypothetical protein [Rubricoccaceae bacterium]